MFDNTNDFDFLLYKYLEHLQAEGFATDTIYRRKIYVNRFFSWCRKNKIIKLMQVSQTTLEKYQKYLGKVKRNDKFMSVESRSRYIFAVSDFFFYLLQNNFILINPAEKLAKAKLPSRIPKDILNKEEIQAIFSCSTELGQSVAGNDKQNSLRDRAILELLYFCGLRRMELVRLNINDIDFTNARLSIRESKCAKDRIVPINPSALNSLNKYIETARPNLIKGNEKTVFLADNNKPFRPDALSSLVGNYVKKATNKKAACHIFRHSIATHLLENGMDIRYIQEFLGHDNINTTKIYTRVSIAKLKEVHEKTHPGKLSELYKQKMD